MLILPDTVDWFIIHNWFISLSRAWGKTLKKEIVFLSATIVKLNNYVLFIHKQKGEVHAWVEVEGVWSEGLKGAESGGGCFRSP